MRGLSLGGRDRRERVTKKLILLYKGVRREGGGGKLRSRPRRIGKQSVSKGRFGVKWDERGKGLKVKTIRQNQGVGGLGF